MRTPLSAFALALGLWAAAPATSSAFWNSPQCSAGFGWLPAKALNCCPSIHYHGPLYNYGPYNGGPGYYDMFVQNPWVGAYVPAWPQTYAMNGVPHTQWSTINPALVNPPAGPAFGIPVNGGQYPDGQIVPEAPTAPAAPAVQPKTAAPIAQAAPQQATVTPVSYRPFRARFQR